MKLFKIFNLSMFKRKRKLKPSELNNIKNFLDENGVKYGICLGSKTGYSNRYPNDLILFNANTFIPGVGKICYGDLNLTKKRDVFIRAKEKFNVDFYLLREMDGRFGNENNPKFKTDAVWNTKTGLRDDYKNYFDNDLNSL